MYVALSNLIYSILMLAFFTVFNNFYVFLWICQFWFLGKLTKVTVIKNTEKSRKKNLVLTSSLYLTFSYSSSLFQLHFGLILLIRVKNMKGQQMLHRKKCWRLCPLTLIMNQYLAGFCVLWEEYGDEKKFIPFISNYLLKRFFGPSKTHCYLSVMHNPHIPLSNQ